MAKGRDNRLYIIVNQTRPKRRVLSGCTQVFLKTGHRLSGKTNNRLLDFGGNFNLAFPKVRPHVRQWACLLPQTEANG